MIRGLLRRLFRRTPEMSAPTNHGAPAVSHALTSAPPPPPPRSSPPPPPPRSETPPPPPPPRRRETAATAESDSGVHLVMEDGTVRRAPDRGELGERIQYVAANLVGSKPRKK